MREAGTLETRPPSPRRRRVHVLLGMVLVCCLLLAAYAVLLFYLADTELQRAIRDTDRLDPGWRLEELDAKRAVIPETENSALVVVNAARLLPTPWPPWRNERTPSRTGLERGIERFAPKEKLSTQQTDDLRSALAKSQLAWVEARKLADMPRGRYPSNLSADVVLADPSHGRFQLPVAELLGFDVLFRVQEQDGDGALASCRGIVNVGRSVGDEPAYFPQLWRTHLRSYAVDKIERVLAQNHPSEVALVAAQELVEQEEKEPLFLIGARGQRAGWDRFLEALQTGTLQAPGNGPLAKPGSLQYSLISTANFNSRPILLELGTRIVEIAKLPVEEQLSRLKQERLFATEGFPSFAKLYFIPRVGKNSADLARAQAQTQAELRCTLAALAAERYRLAHHDWPTCLGELVPTYLAKVPIDPFDGQPLRFRRLTDGLVIYSIGSDGQDNDGNFGSDRRRSNATGTDLGFQLLDPAQRQP